MTPNPKATSHAALFADKGGPFEVFWYDVSTTCDRGARPEGWYWWACHPGCLPDSEPHGPFATSEKAYRNAKE